MKYIALVPGVLGFEKFGRIKYFNGVAEDINEKFRGRVHAEPFDTLALGTVEQRARFLATEITKRFEGRPVHVFAHSMGGLDARLLVARRKTPVADQVKTITAIGTPHGGSPVAQVLNAFNPLDALSRFADLLEVENSIFMELKDNLNAVHDLSTGAAEEFNAQNPDQLDRVKYYEVVGRGRAKPPHTSAVFEAPFRFLHDLHGLPNDGVVPVESATRPGRHPIETWDADHAEMVGHDLDKGPEGRPAGWDHLAAYRKLVVDVVLPSAE
jgi:triacylglycerol lipase